MKYVKTKYGTICKNDMTKAELEDFIERGIIIKQTDNLEDLCDEFIGIYKNQGLEPHFRDITLEGLIEKTTKYCYDNTTLDDLNIYGAIWTYEGLKYVAKMNEDGELELI